jgi:hypothetical protein
VDIKLLRKTESYAIEFHMIYNLYKFSLKHFSAWRIYNEIQKKNYNNFLSLMNFEALDLCIKQLYITASGT